MRIALISPFYAFSDAYSLCHVVADQLKGLDRLGIPTELWTFSSCPQHHELTKGIEHLIKPVIGNFPTDYDKPNQDYVESFAKDLKREVERFQPTHIIGHDLILQGSFLNFACALHQYNLVPPVMGPIWLHYTHSALYPSAIDPAHSWPRRVLPDGPHYILYPNEDLKEEVADYFHTKKERVYGVINPKDPRENLSPEAEEIITNYDLINKDIVMILPICSTRMRAKGVKHTIKLFEALKAKGKQVCFIVVDSSANGPKEKARIKRYQKRSKLDSYELVFTSTLHKHWEHGLANKTVRELFQFSNLFAFFSMGEAGPLSLAEARMAGCLCVLNHAVPSLRKFSPVDTIWQTFDAFNKKAHYRTDIIDNTTQQPITTLKGNKAYRIMMEQLATAVCERIFSPQYNSKRDAMRMFSRDNHAMQLINIATTTQKLHPRLTDAYNTAQFAIAS
jgi:glycosyltransferase involved in cell wall biosynthesis